MKLSVCMIVKNEGKTIRRCLDSMLAFVDEWIIGIDDKTSDNTEKEIEQFFIDNKQLIRNVYKFTWADHFANARNEGMDKATGDYILIMDGHEFFPTDMRNITENKIINSQTFMLEIKKFISDNSDKIEQGFLHLYQQPFRQDNSGNVIPSNYFMQPRIYKNIPENRFHRAAHNTVKNVNLEKIANFPEVMIMHDAPEDNRKERKEQRLRMNTEQLQADINKNPNDTRALFYLGNTHMEAERYRDAVDCYHRYIEIRKENRTAESYQVNLHKALCHKELKEPESCKHHLYEAIKLDPLRRDALIALGDWYHESKDYDRAIWSYNTAISIRPKEDAMFQNGDGNTWMPYQQIAKSYAEKGDKASAIVSLRKALYFINNDGWKEQIKDWSGQKENVLIVDSIGSFTKDIKKKLDSLNYNVIQVKEYNENFGLWADTILQEWADANALQTIKLPEKTVIRIHGYEVYLNKQVIASIPENIKAVICVANHIADMVAEINPAIEKKINVIQNGVDLESFYITSRERQKMSIGYAGFINEKKNPMMLIQMIKKNPECIFHLRIDHQSPFWEKTFEYELQGFDNVVYHGRYENLRDFWNQVDCVISTSIIESFSYNIAEAMACGCKPFIYSWKGASDIWEGQYIYCDPFVIQHKNIDYDANRKYIEERYEGKTQINKLLEVLL